MVSHNAKGKIWNALAILSSLVGYLEWGGGNAMFLAAAEAEVLAKLWMHPLEVLHPLTILPLLGQLLLLITLFQKVPGKWLTFTGLAAIGLLLGLLLFIGIIDTNGYILLSTIPFCITSYFIFRHHRRRSSVIATSRHATGMP